LIAYKTIDGAPGRYFDCPAGMGLLSDKACGNSHILACQPSSIEIGRRFQCRKCEIGRLHAGVSVGTSSIYGRVICPRCCRSATRLAKGLCRSCYNRHREKLLGKNGRGSFPVKHAEIFAAQLLVVGATASVKRFDGVTSVKEAVLGYLRLNDQKVQFGWVGPGIHRLACSRG
jgi:hypothetical protein